MNKHYLLRSVLAPAPRYMLRLSLLEQFFEDSLPKTPYSAIEFGPGLGDVSFYLKKYTACKSLKLVDFSQKTLLMLKNRFANFKSVTFSGEDLLEWSGKERYDVVLAFEVLEHIENDELAFSRLNELTSEGGLLFMSVPAYRSKWQKQDVHAGHVRRYERDELLRKLTGAGYSDVNIVDYGFPLTSIMYPFRQLSYSSFHSESLKDRTKKSGTHRPFFSRLPIWLAYCLYLPFVFLQSFFIDKGLGDGFIAVSRKS